MGPLQEEAQESSALQEAEQHIALLGGTGLDHGKRFRRHEDRAAGHGQSVGGHGILLQVARTPSAAAMASASTTNFSGL